MKMAAERITELMAQLAEANTVITAVRSACDELRIENARLIELIAEPNQRARELEAVINRVAAQIGHPPIAAGEIGIESVAKAVERYMAYAREREETLNSITPESLQVFAASETHHDEHHLREAELEARLEDMQDQRDSNYADCLALEARLREAEAALVETIEDATEGAEKHIRRAVAAEARAEALRVALRQVEWRASGAHIQCLWCHGLRNYGGHRPDCARQAALRPAEQPAAANE